MRSLLPLLSLLSLPAQALQEAFEADPRALLTSAKSVQAEAGDEAVILLDDHHYSFDKQGRLTRTHRQIYFVRKAAAAEDWSTISVDWAPWHQERPRLEARVITADGVVHQLDAKTIAEAPTHQFDATIFSDQRILQAPLPAIAEGAVVEWRSITRETAPLHTAGVAFRVEAGSHVPVARTRIVVESAVPLRHLAQRLDAQVTQANGGTTIRVDMGPLAKPGDLEYYLPRDAAARPFLAFSTGQDWQTVAAAYAVIVDRQIRGADTSALLAGLTANTREAKIAAIFQRVRDQVRYTGVEFGEAAIVPRTPQDVLARKYGDCKDKSALLVAALRAAEIPAHVALLNVTARPDTHPDLPGFHFDHAIVYIPGTPALWIDATDDASRLGDLPTAAQGRQALIADAGTTALVALPEAGADRNLLRITRKITMRDPGGAHMRETVEATGAFETRLRGQYLRKQGDDLKKALEGFVDSSGKGQAKVTAAEKPADGDYREPFRLQYEAADLLFAMVAEDEGAVGLSTPQLFQDLPFIFFSPPKEKATPRTSDLLLPLAYTAELIYDITLPAGFRARPLPASETKKLGPVEYVTAYRSLPEGRLEARLRLTVPRTRLKAVEAAEMHEAIAKLNTQPPPVLLIAHAASEQLAAGQWKEAIAHLRKVASEPGAAAIHQVRLARAYTAIGAGDLARAAARRAVEQDAKSVASQVALGFALEHDRLGQLRHRGWDPAGAEQAYRKALELDKDHLVARVSLAILLEHNALAERYGEGARLADAIAEYDKIPATATNPEVLANRAHCLLRAGRIEEFAQATNTLTGSRVHGVFTLIATALRETPAAAIVRAQQGVPDPEQRGALLAGAALNLISLRRYEPARDLFRAAARSMPNVPTREADFIAGLTKAEDAPAGKEPEQLTRQFYRMIVDGKPDAAILGRILSKHFPLASAVRTIERAHRDLQERQKQTTAMLVQFGAGPAVLRDWALHVKFETDGDEELGFRVRAVEGATFHSLIAREGPELKLIAVSENLAGAGRAALAAVDANKLPQAQRWLDWAVDAPLQSGAPSLPPTRVIWSGTTEAGRSAAVARAAAAGFIVAFDPGDEQGLTLLEAARRLEKFPALREPHERLLGQARIERNEFALALPLAAALEARALSKNEGRALRARALIGLKEWKQLETLLLARVAAQQQPAAVGRVRVQTGIVIPDQDAMRQLAEIAARQQLWAKAHEWNTKLCALEFAPPDDRVACGWSALAAGAQLDAAWRQSWKGTSGREGLLISAAVTANEDPQEALTALRRALTSRAPVDTDAPAWYVQSRILEGTGLLEEARQMRKALPKSNATDFDWAAEAVRVLAAK